MPWIVGIDEAGYGPNLGPFVMTSVTCRIAERHRRADLWKLLRHAACRPEEEPGSRVVVGDSKQVYSPHRGLAALERTVQSFVTARALTLAEFVAHLGPDSHGELQSEAWYTGDTPLPLHADDLPHNGRCNHADVQWGPIRCVIICPAAFNAVLDHHGSKGAVLTCAALRLLGRLPDTSEDIQVQIDKHGGRNNYAANLQPAFSDGMVLAREEGEQRSLYEVEDRGRQIEITIEPRADGHYFCVALASMVSKYLRELLMLEFNEFWRSRIPGLKPTAGYPTDASRFWSDIRPTVLKMGMQQDALWRRR
jgi:ribonuclease HII